MVAVLHFMGIYGKCWGSLTSFTAWQQLRRDFAPIMAKISERLVQVIAKVFGKSLPLSWERFQKDLTPIMKKMVGRLYCSSSYSKGFGKSLPLSWERFQKDLTPIMKKMLVRLTAVMGKFRGKLPHLWQRFLGDLLQILQSLLADLPHLWQSCRKAWMSQLWERFKNETHHI